MKPVKSTGLLLLCMTLSSIPIETDAQTAVGELPIGEFPNEIACEIKVSNPNPLPYEPVVVLVTARYLGAQPVIARWVSPRVGLEIAQSARPGPPPAARPPSQAQWTPYSDYSSRESCGGVDITFPPGYFAWGTAVLAYNSWTKRHVFEEPGVVYIRGWSHGVSSEAIRLEVANPQGKERRAWQKLRELDPSDLDPTSMFARLPLFFAEGGYNVIVRGFAIVGTVDSGRDQPSLETELYGDVQARLTSFENDFSATDYALLAKISLAKLRIEKGDVQAARQPLLEAWAASTSPRAETVAYQLGLCEERLANLTAAADQYRRVVAGRPDPVTKFLAEKALERLGTK